MNGFLCINKPQGPSSFQIVAKVRKALGIKKAGHAGTLDPDATGLLVIATGYATRLLQYIPNDPKVYRFGIQFGSQTDTLDSKGAVVFDNGTYPPLPDLIEVLTRYKGDIFQEPPAYSAKKIDGQRAYKLARDGNVPSLKPNKITIYSLDLLTYDQTKGCAELQVSCSGGTYVRSLARDIAIDLNTYGHTYFIHRVSSGVFDLSRAINIDDLHHAVNYIMPSHEVFHSMPRITLTENEMLKLTYGQDISLPEFSKAETKRLFAFYNDNLLAVLQWKQDILYHPVTVFPISR